MRIMINGPKHRLRYPKLCCEPSPSMAALSRASIQLLVEIGGGYVKFVRINANYRAILFVHTTDFEGVLATLNDIVIEFKP